VLAPFDIGDPFLIWRVALFQMAADTAFLTLTKLPSSIKLIRGARPTIAPLGRDPSPILPGFPLAASVGGLVTNPVAIPFGAEAAGSAPFDLRAKDAPPTGCWAFQGLTSLASD
jgi:hypothetical protein